MWGKQWGGIFRHAAGQLSLGLLAEEDGRVHRTSSHPNKGLGEKVPAGGGWNGGNSQIVFQPSQLRFFFKKQTQRPGQGEKREPPIQPDPISQQCCRRSRQLFSQPFEFLSAFSFSLNCHKLPIIPPCLCLLLSNSLQGT